MIADIPSDVNSVDNCSDSTFIIISTATELYKAYIDSLKNKFDSAYAAKCLSAYKLEKFTVKHLASEFHYTLYYYDQAGNLVKTVPPQGVQVNRDSLWLDSVRTARRLGQEKLPAHSLQTEYRYNTLNQVVAQHSPDGGKTEFWYDRLGRLVLSSNAKQKAAGSGDNGRLYSYTLYDELGRITEVGQVSNTTANGAVTDSITRNGSLLSAWYYTLANRRGQITSTVYDVAYTGFGSPSPLEQRNLRNRVSYTTYTDTATLSSFNNGTFFTYDIHGNVDTLLQHYGNKLISGLANVMNKNNNGYKKIVYKYDLISGKVNMVAYNPHNIDEFYHRYAYDAGNRLTLAETSTDSIHWEKEARYEYYRHGPLARTILGDQQVQGMDYAYTLQGWLKGVNSISLSANFDMGGDGKTGSINQPVAKDEVGFNLNYYTGDYLPVNATVNPFPTHTAAGGLAADDNRPLYNGNISSMAVNIKKLIYPGVAAYHYDQLNRITGRKSYYNLDQTNNNWNGLTATKSFEEKFSYDANGNILTADRYTSATWGFMDSLTYSYYPGTNKLRRVRDFGYTMYGFNPPDIADQSASDNYTYDEIGNLTGDAQEGITNIKWSVYGKILEIDRTASTYNPVIKIRYDYDAAGNRISKEVRKNGSDTVEYSWYVRDAQGNIMSTYTAVGDTAGVGLNGLTLNIIDQPLYGSSRIGVLTRHSTAEDSWYPFNERSNLRGLKQYELTNHLGNVLVTVSDRKTPLQSGSDPTQVDHFDADVQNAYDYYAFGMVMPDRKFTGPAYRYGFNGKENDNEVKGPEGSQQDYGMRIYDPRLGRFLSVDPITAGYPEYTPYQYAGNKPIWSIDLDGMEEYQFQKNSKALEIANIFKRGIEKDQAILKQSTDITLSIRINESLQCNKDAYSKWIVYLYKHRQSAEEKAGEALLYGWDKSEPILRALVPADEAKALFTGTDLDNNPQSRVKAAVILALTIFTGGEYKSLSTLSEGLRYANKFGKCEAFAAEFISKFGRAIEKTGAQVKKFEINIGGGGLIGTAEKQFANNGMHQFVEVIKDGTSMIYDNLNPKGLAKEEYIKLIAGQQKNGDKVIEGAELLSKYTKEVPK